MVLSTVWLEDAHGRRWPVAASCSLGRSTSNDIVVEDKKVSRRHALVHQQDDTEFWVIDLGSGNGTYLNGRRVTQPTRLGDGDCLTLGDHAVTFRQISVRQSPSVPSVVSEQTIINIKSVACWLLLADIKDSTAMAGRLSPTDMAMQVGRWMGACKEIVDGNGGAINKFLGDGFFAYWLDARDDTISVVAALAALRRLQESSSGPPFRMAVHQGQVAFGGGGSLGEDSLSGLDVTLAFRMEKIAARLGCDAIASEVARDRLGWAGIEFRDLGSQTVPGIDNPQRFYAMA